MKKGIFALVTVLVFALFMSGVTAIDGMGLNVHFVNGDKYVCDIPVVVVNDSHHYYHYDRIVYENATVVTTTDNVVKVLVDGKVISSPNGRPFRFSAADMHMNKPHYTNMPAAVKKGDESPVKPVDPIDPPIKPVDHSKEYIKIGDAMNHFINEFGKSGKEKTFRDVPYIVQVDNVTFRLVKLFEPIREVQDTVPFTAIYEDLGGYYRVSIESTAPFLGLKQTEKTIRYINAGGNYYPKNFKAYQNYLTGNDEINKTYINTMTFEGKYVLLDGTKTFYQEYRHEIEYTIERTAAKPDFAKED